MRSLAVVLVAASTLLAADPDPKVVDAQTRFGIKLYEQIAKEEPGKNVFLSPTSILLALSMTWNGADEGTRDGMARALEMSGLSAEVVNAANRALIESLADADPKVKLSIANSLWARKGIPFLDGFMAINKASYHAEAQTRDFADPATLAAINDWIAGHTGGKIQKMLAEVEPAALLYLVNAIYFKGQWTDPFDPERTKEMPFTRADGSKKDVKMMSRIGAMDYLDVRDDEAKGEGFQAVALPYGGGRMQMVFLLPYASASLEYVHRTLNAEAWKRWMGGFERREVDLQLPRFKSEYGIELRGALTGMGMSEAFDPERANFSKMTSAKACISFVLHRTFVEVNEEGTEAAAATVVGMKAGGKPPRPVEVHLDRPFFFAIRDTKTGTLLFLGSIVDP